RGLYGLVLTNRRIKLPEPIKPPSDVGTEMRCGGSQRSSSWGQCHETTSQTILASRRSRHHATGPFEHRTGGKLSDPGGANYPPRPVHLVVGYPPGLAPDIIARLVGAPLSERLGRPVVIDNRPGAGSNLGTEFVATAAPDGHTLLLVTSTNAFNATIYDNLIFNFIRDIAPVADIDFAPFVMVVSPAVPARTVSEFIAYAKANPNKIHMASAGVGTAPHVFGELFNMMTGANLIHVPYRSSYFPDLLSGQVQVTFNAVTSSIGYIK